MEIAALQRKHLLSFHMDGPVWANFKKKSPTIAILQEWVKSNIGGEM